MAVQYRELQTRLGTLRPDVEDGQLPACMSELVLGL